MFLRSKKTIKNNKRAQKRLFSERQQFSQDVVMKKNALKLLYRGISEVDYFTLFHPAAIVVGLPSRQSFNPPKTIKARDIVIHKDSNRNANQNYFLSATSDAKIASTFGKVIVTIDAGTPAKWVNVEQTYFKACKKSLNHDEAENAAMAVLISNIKFIMDKHRNSNEILQNPFYLPIDANDKKLVKKYHAVYTAYCDVLTKSNPNHQQYDKNELSQLIKKYTHELIGLYATVLKENSPFNLTLPKFAEKYPAFTKEMSRFNHPQFSHAKFFGTTHSPKMMTLGELIAKLSHSLYLQHDYIPMKQSLQTPKKIQRMA